MKEVDIFAETTPESGEFFKFEKIGDKIQGTYISMSQSIDTFQNNQNVYLIKDSAGKIWNVAFRESNVIVNERMKAISLGQIVGFSFDEERPGKMGNKAKIIRIYADPKYVDDEWIKQQAVLDSVKPAQAAPIDLTPPPTNVPEAPTGSEEAPIKNEDVFTELNDNKKAEEAAAPLSDDGMNKAVQAVLTLAHSKGLTTAKMSDSEAYKEIEKYTELPLIEENMTSIIIKLTSYTK